MKSGWDKLTSETTEICLLEIFTYTITMTWAGKDGQMRNIKELSYSGAYYLPYI